MAAAQGGIPKAIAISTSALRSTSIPANHDDHGPRGDPDVKQRGLHGGVDFDSGEPHSLLEQQAQVARQGLQVRTKRLVLSHM